jgi:predicted GIY-YIG superfamily endonuclease
METTVGSEINYVYCVRAGTSDEYKIGIAKRLGKRLKQLQTGNAKELTIVGAIICPTRKHARAWEKRYRKKFKKSQLIGEWHRLKKPAFLGLVDKRKETDITYELKIESDIAKLLGSMGDL